MTMMDRMVEMFGDVMSNRAVAIVVMIAAAIGGILAIAGGYFSTYKLITVLSNGF